MFSIRTAASRHRTLLLASSFLVLASATAHAQTPPVDLPPVDVSPPTDPNKTRARPLIDEGGGVPRPARSVAPVRGAGTGTSDGTSTGTSHHASSLKRYCRIHSMRKTKALAKPPRAPKGRLMAKAKALVKAGRGTATGPQATKPPSFRKKIWRNTIWPRKAKRWTATSREHRRRNP